jgi:hypothetical protein
MDIIAHTEGGDVLLSKGTTGWDVTEVSIFMPTDTSMCSRLSVNTRLVAATLPSSWTLGRSVETVVDKADAARLLSLRQLRDLSVSPKDSQALEILTGLPALQRLTVDCSGLDPKDIASIARISGLTALSLRTYLKNYRMAFLSSLPHLRELDCGDAVLTKDEVAALTALSELRVLRVRVKEWEPDATALLPAIGTLEALDVDALPAGLAQRFKGLRRLSLVSDLTDECSGELQRCPTLANLALAGSSAKGLANAGKLKALARLEIGNASEIREDDWGSMKNLSGLRELVLGWAEISDKGMAQVGELNSLRTLSIVIGCHSSLTDTGVEHLAKMDRLESLSFFCNWPGDRLTENSEKAICGMGNLQRLHLRIWREKKVACDFTALKNLRALCVEQDIGVAALAGVSKLEKLEELEIEDAIDREMLKLLSSMSNLRRLSIRSAGLSLGDIVGLVNSLPRLEQLRLR